MDTNPENQKIKFECRITTRKGKRYKTYYSGSKEYYTGKTDIYEDILTGNYFEYDLIEHKGNIYKPFLRFELFRRNRRKFYNDFKLAYEKTVERIHDEEKAELALDLFFDNAKLINENKELKEQLNRMKVKHKIYFKEYDEIYFNNLDKITNISEEELKYINKDYFHRINRISAFKLLLYRHKDENDFLLKCDLNNQDTIKDLHIKFYDSYRKDRKANKKQITPKRGNHSLKKTGKRSS